MGPAGEHAESMEGAAAAGTAVAGTAMVTRGEAAGIARLRASRMSMLSRTPWIGPWLGRWLWPWTWSLTMVTLARHRIERDPGVSLALTGSSRATPVDPTTRRVGLCCYLGALLGVLVVVTVAAVLPWSLATVGFVLAGVAVLPLLLEVTALLLNMLLRPGQLLLGRRRRQLTGRGHHAVILTDYVRDPVSPKGSGQLLLDRLAAGWAADRTIVLLYPANRKLHRMYADRGAVPDSRWTRRMRFDYTSGALGPGR